MRLSWPRAAKLALIQQASSHGEAEAILNSPREAELFRYALHRFLQRRNGYKKGTFAINIEGSKVILRKYMDVKIGAL